MTDPSKEPRILIEKLVPGGDGLGHLDGGAVFVPLTAPGDIVVIRELQKRRGVLFARSWDLVEGSDLRRHAPCPWYGRCGGCQWMHLDYPVQLQWKEDIFRQVLTRIGRLHQVPAFRVHPAPTEFEYRFRARMQIRGTAVGFYRRGSNSIVPWDRCLLLPGALNAAVKEVRALLRDSRAPASLRSCEVALSPVDGGVTCDWLFSARRGGGPVRQVMDRMQRGPLGSGGALRGQRAHDRHGRVVEARGGSVCLDVQGVTIPASPGSFFQVNPEVNEILVGRVLAHLKAAGADKLLDLYCGHGNFSLPAAAAGMMTVGVDSSPGAVGDAVSVSGPGSRFVEMDVVRYLTENTAEREAVLVDPPRTGLPAEVIRLLTTDRCRKLLYVSCEPSTLARDLASLTGAGYVITEVELFDMFPQTFHSEALVVMEEADPHAR